MNFFDNYDLAGSSTPPSTEQTEPSLEQEVQQVVGQLSRFWGGFRKQSQSALQAARKDLGDVVSQAQKELSKLAAETAAATEGSSAAATDGPTNEEATAQSPSAEEPITDPSISRASDDAETTPPATSPTSPATEPTPAQAQQAHSLLARLQASLPPNLVSTVQQQVSSVQQQLPHARGASISTLDFAQLRNTIAAELAKVQDATGDVVQRSEGLLREAGEFLREAVKVVPPEEGAGDTLGGVVWDGSDVWALSTATAIGAAASGKGKEREGRTTPSSGSGSGRPSMDIRAATRAEALLKQLRYDPEVIKADPEADERAQTLYATWVEEKVNSMEEGINSEAWLAERERALDGQDGSALLATLETLVPVVIPVEVFWTRYFFRVYQVEQEEERRKALLQGTIDTEEDFSWEDDEEEVHQAPKGNAAQGASSTSPSDAVEAPSVIASLAVPPSRSHTSTPGTQSPRQSSEDSYDVVSGQVSMGPASPKESKEGDKSGTPKGKAEEDDDADSDWE
ncbi:hypothetical protein CERSUDRAFT_119045 [Gelatoporia subvermispora B]|uniref:BSD domain-containing protein n=1 Tax=Ceriporiopsis subvermispora (strain B) TaxID=914234 RepID=M2QIW2_CERS8|nr:hypothetical protein CERSUDRAFT_119045 [Gelatoporia subvermispora B]